jgi:hypothetical protein
VRATINSKRKGTPPSLRILPMSMNQLNNKEVMAATIEM